MKEVVRILECHHIVTVRSSLHLSVGDRAKGNC